MYLGSLNCLYKLVEVFKLEARYFYSIIRWILIGVLYRRLQQEKQHWNIFIKSPYYVYVKFWNLLEKLYTKTEYWRKVRRYRIQSDVLWKISFWKDKIKFKNIVSDTSHTCQIYQNSTWYENRYLFFFKFILSDSQKRYFSNYVTHWKCGIYVA